MTRGNQREIDRQRAANRHASGAPKLTGDPKARNEANAKALADKVKIISIFYFMTFKFDLFTYFFLRSLERRKPKQKQRLLVAKVGFLVIVVL